MKKVLNIIANIINIIFMVILIISCCVIICRINEMSSTINDNSFICELFATFAFILLFSFVCCIMSCCALAYESDSYKIAVCVFLALLGILYICSNSSAIYVVLCFIIFILELTAICSKDTKQQTNNTSIANTSTPKLQTNIAPVTKAPISKEQTIDNKISEIKHLKELGVLSNEQYETAINNIVNKVSTENDIENNKIQTSINIEKQINEIKQLKQLGILNEEQYEIAVNNLINQIKKDD